MHLDTVPKFPPPEIKVGPVNFFPAIIALHKMGDDEPKIIRTEISQVQSLPKGLAISSNLIEKILQYDLLSIIFSVWAGDAVTATVPLKGAAAATIKVQRKCDSERTY